MGICCNKSKRENGSVAVNMKGDQILSHFNAEWKFKKADLMNLKVSEYLDGKYYYDINIPGLQYNIDVYLPPDHYDDTWIFLKVNGSNKRNINVKCTVHVPSAYVSKKLRGVYKSESDAQGIPFCKTSELFDSKSKLFVDGEMIVKVKGTFRAPIPTIPKICAPISFEWKNKEEDLKKIVNEESNNGHLFSDEISVSQFSDVSYRLKIHPNEIQEGENEAQTWLYLVVDMGDETKFEVVFDFSIDSASFYRGNQNFWKEFEEYQTYLCSTEDLFNPSKKYFVDGYLTINFKGVIYMAE